MGESQFCLFFSIQCPKKSESEKTDSNNQLNTHFTYAFIPVTHLTHASIPVTQMYDAYFFKHCTCTYFTVICTWWEWYKTLSTSSLLSCILSHHLLAVFLSHYNMLSSQLFNNSLNMKVRDKRMFDMHVSFALRCSILVHGL